MKTYLPHSRIARESPSRTAIKFPKELRAIKKFSPFTAPLEPNTAVKNKLAVI